VQSNSSDLNSADAAASTYLTLRTNRQPDFQSAAEIENEQKNLYHASIRFLARVTGDPGAVVGLFTYADEKDEADIEILTADPSTTYRFTNQPSVDKHGNVIERASVTGTNLPAWTDWHVHRIDWVKGVCRWFLDGQEVAVNTYSVPKKPSGIILNVWSDGGVWSGNMSVGGKAEMHLQWIQVAFNTSGDRDGPSGKRGSKMKTKRNDDSLGRGSNRMWHGQETDGYAIQGLEHLVKRAGTGKRRCANVCVIDGVAKEGFPEMVYAAKAERLSPYTPLVILCAALVVWISGI
jgi:beta-glucanase (GH16 family)